MRVIVETSRCLGSGNCLGFAPGVFDQRDDDGIVILLDPEPPADREADVRQAAALCPARAIVLEES
jgi:ferredoxin